MRNLIVKFILWRARRLITNPKHWCRHSMSKDKNGNPTWESKLPPVSFCAIGALEHVTRNPTLRLFRGPARDLLPYRLSRLNDTQGHAAVLEAYDAAIKRA